MWVAHIAVAHADVEDARVLLIIKAEIVGFWNIGGGEGVVLAGFFAAGQEGRISGPASGSDKHLGVEHCAVRQGNFISFD